MGNANVKAKYWLDRRHYIAEMDNPKCLALVTVDKNGEITRCVVLGLKK